MAIFPNVLAKATQLSVSVGTAGTGKGHTIPV